MSTIAPTPVWTFGERVRKARRELDLTQDGFADLLALPRVSAKAIARWEAGGTPEHIVDVARRLEELTGWPAAWFLGVDTPSPAPDNGGSALRSVPSNRDSRGYLRPLRHRKSLMSGTIATVGATLVPAA